MEIIQALSRLFYDPEIFWSLPLLLVLLRAVAARLWSRWDRDRQGRPRP